MSQDNLDKKIKTLFGSMNDPDLNEALLRKEAIWQSVHPNKEKKKDYKILLILLLGLACASAGWFLRNLNANQSTPTLLVSKDTDLSIKANDLAIAEIKTQLDLKEKQLDSLSNANKILANELSALVNTMMTAKTKKIEKKTVYLRDTFYIKEIQIEQQIVEKVIKDTILIEVPIMEEIQATMAEANSDDLKNISNKDQNTKETTPSASIQFNFSNSNSLDK